MSEKHIPSLGYLKVELIPAADGTTTVYVNERRVGEKRAKAIREALAGAKVKR